MVVEIPAACATRLILLVQKSQLVALLRSPFQGVAKAVVVLPEPQRPDETPRCLRHRAAFAAASG